MLSVNGRNRVELLLVRGTNAVLSRENYLPRRCVLTAVKFYLLRPISNFYSQENFSCVSSALSLAVFSLWHQRFLIRVSRSEQKAEKGLT